MKGKRNVKKIDLKNVDNLYDDLSADVDDELDFEDEIYDSAFSGDTLESEDLIASLDAPKAQKIGYPAILEYVDGRREEILWIHLFEPSENELTLDYGEGDTKVISLELVSCIRMARIPSIFPRQRDENCHVEIVEMLDGNIYHEIVHHVQDQKKVLFGFSTKKDTRFKYTLIPRENIKKRFQRRQLGKILVDKKLVTDDILQSALNEHNELKKIKFGRVIAEQANILYSAVEKEIQKAYQNPQQNMKIGEILLKAGLVNEEQILQALAYQRRLQNRKLGQFLIEKGILQEKDLYTALAEKFRIPFVDLRHQKGSRKALTLLPPQVIQKLLILPLSVDNGRLTVATALPEPKTLCEVLVRYSPIKDIDFVLTQPSHLRNVIRMLFQRKE